MLGLVFGAQSMQMKDFFNGGMNRRLIVGDSISHSIARLLLTISVKIIERFDKKSANNAKRLLFISSVYTEMVREGLLNQITYEQLNEIFCLANNVDCLNSGCVISMTVWRDTDFKMAINNSVKNQTNPNQTYTGINDIDSFTRYLIESTPTWIRYDQQSMTQDIKDLFAQRKSQLSLAM